MITKLSDIGRAEQVEPKSHFWNSGSTAFDTKKAYKIYDVSGQSCINVIEIWYRNDGFNNRAFEYGTEKAYKDYKPSTKTTHAIEQEIAM